MAKKMVEREESGVKSRIWSSEEGEERVKVVSVIYYIARNGQLEHPHLMEVPLYSSHPMLSLKDVINRLNFLRGQGMAHSYSWSAKRSYKNGYVWQDLSENDFIYPCNAHTDEYILKGTQLFQVSSSSSFRSNDAAVTISPPSSKDCSSETTTTSSSTDTDSAESAKKMITMKMKEAWKIAAINASTQTEENQEIKGNESDEEVVVVEDIIRDGTEATALPVPGNIRENCRMEENESNQSGRMMKASTVLMQLIRCVSSKKLHRCDYERAST